MITIRAKKIRDLSEKYDLSEKSIRNILREKGIDYSREWKEKSQKIKEQLQGNTEKSNEKHSEENEYGDLRNDLTEDLIKNSMIISHCLMKETKNSMTWESN